ncbi:Rrf2 family transcriptional regulator [Camelliibacillus cellulosilyticus]|uniref:HTH-type transcriptional regulator NsrR n=1 Tax=Camelliibacillus cellulosilyticus TaxID=2174486 RepID=A0ABV9GMC8_9BACL
MRLTSYTDYSMRTLIYLAALPEDRLANIQEIADIYHISKHHLTKVVHHLGKLGLIQTVRGRGGGIRLGKDPAAINLGWLIRQTEDDFQLVECFNNQGNACIISPVCRLRTIFGEALQNYLATLDRYSLADVLENKEALQERLL